jgi:hypothetical protein
VNKALSSVNLIFMANPEMSECDSEPLSQRRKGFEHGPHLLEIT